MPVSDYIKQMFKDKSERLSAKRREIQKLRAAIQDVTGLPSRANKLTLVSANGRAIFLKGAPLASNGQLRLSNRTVSSLFGFKRGDCISLR